MPLISFMHSDGHVDEVEADVGSSVMQAAMKIGVDGIIAECGGSAMCATCHVLVDPEWQAVTGERNDVEDEMLNDTEAPRQDNSRLSCQIKVTEAMDGLKLYIPS